MNRFRLDFFDQAAAFLTISRPLLEAQEVVYSLMLGLAETMAAKAAPIRGWIVRRGDRPHFIVFQTPPHNLILSAAPDLSSVSFAASEIARGLPSLDFLGLVGPVHECDAFRAAWTQATGHVFHLGFRQRLFEAAEARPPAGITGELISADLSHWDLVTEWTHRFCLEALPHETPTIEKMREQIRVRLEAGQMFLWRHEGRFVSQAGLTRPTRHGVSVWGVYTPPESRGRGYASAVVGHLTALQLRQGRKFCALYTDLANPTSNSIYSQVGYRPVADSVHWIRDGARAP